jgi:cell division protein FtsW (lipid II flippase)
MHRVIHLSCAAAAIACGAVVLVRLGAPTSYLAVNVAALIGGAALGWGLSTIKAGEGPFAVLLGAVIVATALFGVEVEGAVRWVAVGGFAAQPGFLAAPIVLLCYARRQDAWSLAAVALAALGLALQPDRALAGALLAALLVLAARRPVALNLAAAAMATAAFASTLLRPDVVAPRPFVEGVVSSAFADGAMTGLAAAAGLALLVAPFFLGAMFGAASAQSRLDHVLENTSRRTWSRLLFYRAFFPKTAHTFRERALALSTLGVFWAATIVAALVGSYPTPFIGYGASAIAGYVMSMWLAWDGARECAI